MAQSTTLLNIKLQITNAYKQKILWIRERAPFLLPLFFLILLAPVLSLLLNFKKENSLYRSMLQTLNHIHLSEKKLHATSAKEQIQAINTSLQNINPLEKGKKTLVSLVHHLPQSAYENMIQFFNKNQIILEEKQTLTHSGIKEILYALKNPVYIQTDEINTLVNLVEADENITFDYFTLSKESATNDQLKLDFNLKIVTPNE